MRLGFRLRWFEIGDASNLNVGWLFPRLRRTTARKRREEFHAGDERLNPFTLLTLAQQPGDPVRSGAKSMRTMNDLFLHFLQDIYYAEKAFAKSSGKILRAARNDELREILKKAKEHAKEPIEALDRVFGAVDKRPRGKACEAMNGLLAECQEAMEQGEPGPVLDAALIACLQGIKTYEITRYGSLRAFARQMGLDAAVEELEKLRDAARNDDEALSKIAEGEVNIGASDEEGEDDESKEPDQDEEPGEDDEKGKPQPKLAKKPMAKRGQAGARRPVAGKGSPR